MVSSILLWWIGAQLNAAEWYYIVLALRFLAKAWDAYCMAKREGFMF